MGAVVTHFVFSGDDVATCGQEIGKTHIPSMIETDITCPDCRRILGFSVGPMNDDIKEVK